MRNKIERAAVNVGIRDIGFCEFSDVAEKLLDCRARQRIPANAKTVIVCLFPYRVKDERPLNISRYAAVPDYHRVCGAYLEKLTAALCNEFPENSFEFFIDNSPIPEVSAASAAGLGLTGENGLLITPRYGSWVFIGEIVTDLEIKCENKAKKCSLCGDCKKACPRGVHGTDCLSAVSQRKNSLTDAEITALKGNNIVWGCDICAEVCPLNRNTEPTFIQEFIDGYRDCFTTGEDISGRAYEWRGSKTVERNLSFYKDIM